MQSLPKEKKKTFSTNLEQITLKMCMKSQNISIAKPACGEKKKLEEQARAWSWRSKCQVKNLDLIQ